MNTIKKGSRGDDVKLIQRLLNLRDDGLFGSQTELFVKMWQKENGLVPDGVVGPRSWQKIEAEYCVSPIAIYDPLVVHITQQRNRIEVFRQRFSRKTDSKRGGRGGGRRR